MVKYAVIFLIISMLAGAMGFMNISTVARRISFVLFGLFLVMAALVLVFFILLDKATSESMLFHAFSGIA